jgi:hypothetical protein
LCLNTRQAKECNGGQLPEYEIQGQFLPSILHEIRKPLRRCGIAEVSGDMI